MKLTIVYGKPIRYFIDGVEVSKKKAARRFPSRFTGAGLKKGDALLESTRPACWPFAAELALERMADQKVESEQDAAAKGVPTEFARTEFGCAPVFRDRGHRNQYLKAYGLYDRGAGYGDHDKQNR